MANGDETAELLGRVTIFSGLTHEQLVELASVAVPRSWAAGEVIFREGDPGDTCYVVQSGAVRVLRNHSDGRTITLAELRPGNLFGELAMFDTERRSATVEAAADTRAVALLAGDMRRLLLRHPDMSLKLLSAFAERLREANERISRQSFQTVASRVAGVLLEQAATLTADGAGEVRRADQGHPRPDRPAGGLLARERQPFSRHPRPRGSGQLRSREGRHT